jgi:hypothetical protein
MKKLLLAMMFLALTVPALAAEPMFVFEKAATSAVPPDFQAWHSQFEKNGDYGDSWFFYAQTDEGGALFAMLAVTNLGLSTYMTSIDVQYYAPDGKRHAVHKEYARDVLTASSKEMDTKVAKNRVWGGGNTYHYQLDEPEMKLLLNLENVLPSYKFGDGAVKFYNDKSAEWTLGINCPRAVSSGTLEAGGKTYNMKGRGYHDHGWATIKLPSFIKKWFTVRIFHDKYTVVFHHQYITPKFGGGNIKFGFFGTENAIITPLRDFIYEPKSYRPDTSPYKIPTELEIAFEGNGWKVSGNIVEEKFLESIDVLGQVSWPVRMLIKAFYTNPFLIRYMGHYELDVTGPEGKTERIKGTALIESNYY